MFRKQIIKKHLGMENIDHVIGHHWSVFFPMTIRTILFLLAAYLFYLLLSNYIQWDYLHWIFAFVGIFIFIKYVYDFLGIYLDGVVLSDDGISFFMWQGISDYKVDLFEWDKIETVNYSQNSIWDKIFSRGNISIKLHEIDFPFDDVPFPRQQVDRILKMKALNGANISDDMDNLDIDSEKVSILADALGEVIKEYMHKKPKEEVDSDLF